MRAYDQQRNGCRGQSLRARRPTRRTRAHRYGFARLAEIADRSYAAKTPQLTSLKPSDEILRALFATREARKDKRAPATTGDPVQKIRDALLPHYIAQAEARVRIAARTEAPFYERLVQFWSNHFAVSIDKPVCLGIAGALENEAIRPLVTGHFSELLRAVEQHPAMIAYLDNQASAGPDSQLARLARPRANAQRKVGINENLAREILELHTLGVDGGYSQADVTTFANVLTGWSIGGGEGRLAGGTAGRYFSARTCINPDPKLSSAGTTHNPAKRRVLRCWRISAGILDGATSCHQARAPLHRR